MKASTKPLIAITMGDPSGIGPEIILKLSQQKKVFEMCRPLIIGDRRILERGGEYTGLAHIGLDTIADAQDVSARADVLSTARSAKCRSR